MRFLNRHLSRLALVGLVALTFPAAGSHGAETATAPRGSEAYFGNIELVDQHGERHRLYSDLLKDKLVVINAMFTSCASACPAMAGRLAKIQRW